MFYYDSVKVSPAVLLVTSFSVAIVTHLTTRYFYDSRQASQAPPELLSNPKISTAPIGDVDDSGEDSVEDEVLDGFINDEHGDSGPYKMVLCVNSALQVTG